MGQAKQYMEDPAVGDGFEEEVPPVELGRIAAQSAKQVILQKVREAERDRQYEEFIDRESHRPNDRIRAYIKEVRREARCPQIFLSRTAPEFMAELFKMEVPEIYEGIIEIKAVARDPGS